jgi:isoamylase
MRYPITAGRLHIVLNIEQQEHSFEIPVKEIVRASIAENRNWYRVVDTAQPSPIDIAAPGQEELLIGKDCRLRSHSIVVLISR